MRHAIGIRRTGFALLLACALLVRLLVPAGWMPVAGADGGIAISVCSGSGPMEMVLAPDGTIHEKAPARDHGGDHPCAFAGAVAPLAAAAPPAIVSPVVVRAPPIDARRLVSVGRGLAAPPPPQTGPPTLI